MPSLIGLPVRFLRSFFRSQADLEAEIVALGQQLIVAMRRALKQLVITNTDRPILTWLCHLWPRLLGSMMIVKPETVLRWHRAEFRAFWSRKSRSHAGRSRIDPDLRALIRRMSRENDL